MNTSKELDRRQEIGELDLAAKVIDLTTALLDATKTSNSLLRGAWEIGQWLGRERLNQYELLDCMEKAKNLVFANRDGQEFLNHVIHGLDTRPVKPLFLQQSGSLGRLMAGDPNLSWFVSTVASLFQHHRDERLVTEKLTAFIIHSHNSQLDEEAAVGHDSSSYSGERSRLRAVILKIVSSVWYNVINVGCQTIPLPEELLSICLKGHFLDPDDFAIVTNAIYSKCPSKAVLRTTFLPRDVVLWLLLHYDGIIVVNAGGQIVYQVDLGNPKRELEIRVEVICANAGRCDANVVQSYKIARYISGRFDDFLSGYSMGSEDIPPQQSGIRRVLYDVPRLYHSDSVMWNKSLQLGVKQAAQSMMRWLLNVPLLSQENFSTPGFSAEPGKQADPEQMTIFLVLKRVPSMINLQWGTSQTAKMVFVGTNLDAVGQSVAGNDGITEKELRLTTVLEYFPVLCDLMAKMCADCKCLRCGGRPENRLEVERMDLKRLQPGCLKRIALEEVFLLVAHGIADGFGVDDVSSVIDSTSIVDGMVALLLELVQQRQIRWDTWFAVASCVYLGCPFEPPVQETHVSFGGTAFAAIQYGNLAAQAPWLDLSEKLTVRGCFGLVGSRGRLGVVSEGNDQKLQFRSVEENFAIIETENTEDTSSYCSRHKKPISDAGQLLHLVEDTSLVSHDVILSQMDHIRYRLFLRIKTSRHWRTVDPSDALSAVIRILPSTTCRHDKAPQETQLPTKIYTFDEVVGRWPDTVQAYDHASPMSGVIHLTQVLNTHLKTNIALALSVCPTTVLYDPEDVCLRCGMSLARTSIRAELRQGEAGNAADRYIVNVKTRPRDTEKYLRRELVEG